MGIKSAWNAAAKELFSKEIAQEEVAPGEPSIKDGSPSFPSQFTVPSGTGYTSYAPRTVANVTQIGYMNNVIVYRAVAVLAQAIAGLPWQVKSRYGKQSLVANHPLQQLMERPNLKRARSSFIEQMISYLLIGGQNFMYPVLNGQDLRPLGLYNLRPDLMMPFYGDDGAFLGWRYNVMKPVTYTQDQVHVTRFFHPFDEYNGLSPLQVASALIERQNAGEEWNFNLMSNMARPSGAFVSTVDLPPLTRGKLVQEIRKKYGRGRATAGMPLLLENGLSYVQLALSPVDADWYNSDGAAGRKIAAAIGVDSVLLNDKEHSTYNNVLEAKVAMWELAGLPLLGRVEDDLNMWMPMGYGDDVMLVADRSPIELLKKNRSIDTAIIVNVWNAGLASFNACAQDLVQEPLPDKDDFFKFGPLLYVRKSSVADWLDQQEERRNAPPMVGSPINNSLLPMPRNVPSTVVQETQSDSTTFLMKNISDDMTSMRNSHIAPFQTQVADFFHAEMGRVLAACKDTTQSVTTALATIQGILSLGNPTFQDLVTHQYIASAEAACVRVGQQFGVNTSIYQKATASDIAVYVNNSIVVIQQTTWDAIMALGYIQTVPELVNALKNMYQEWDTTRTGVIAENETLTAMNLGSAVAAKQVGIPLMKTWHTVGDERVRPGHKDANGQSVPLDGTYNIDGDSLSFPKDFSHGARPDNIVNCRCYETYQADFRA